MPFSRPEHLHSHDNVLRFVFDDKVLSFNLAADATLQDIARTFGKFPKGNRTRVKAIDVTLSESSHVIASKAMLGAFRGSCSRLN